jgi:carboxypeptidase family protein
MIAMLFAVALALSQPPARDARVTLTVVDQTGAVIQNATVTVSPSDDPKAAVPPAKTNDKGIATFAGLPPGRYSIQAEFSGFEPRVLKDVRLKSGDNKHVAVLAIQGLQDSVTVSRDAREAASDRRATFGTALTREQIESLSDDPDEMQQQLQDMAGGNAVIRVDSFEGGRLPPKAAIKAVHITRDAFAAENHYAGAIFIDIITQPGMGPLRTNMMFRLRSGTLSGRPPADISTAPKGPERTEWGNGGIGGSLIKQKASFSINAMVNRSFDTPYFNYTGPDGVKVTSLAPRRPRDNTFVVGLFDYAITRDQTVRMQYFEERSSSRNIGIGGFDLLERGYSNEDHNHTLRLQEAGPLGRRFFTNTRASINWANSDSRSVFEGPTIVVLDTFTSGGRQQRGGVRSKTIDLQSDLDYVRGINSVRSGIQLNGGSYHSNTSNNYLGTYTFESMAAFAAGQPRSYTVRVGDPSIDYWNLQAGMYVQDDIRVRKNLTLSPGVRYELQTHLSDYNNFGPRFGITWSPGKSGKTTLRGSAGMFYDWLSTGIYEQTIRVDGYRQRELNVFDPSFPVVDATALGFTAPTNRYVLSNGLQMQRNTRLSAGVERQVTRMVRVNATYAHTLGSNLMRGENLNAPVNGIRPDPTFSNVVEVVDDARLRQDNFNLGAIVNFNVPKGGGPAAPGGPVMINGGMMIMTGPAAAPAPGGAKNPANARWNWRRMSIFTNFGVNRALNNTDGAFSTPATGNIADDWGPALFDVRRRFNIGWNSQQLRNFMANMNFNASSAQPYTIRSGVDTNGDLIFNDRPAGVARNSARARGMWNVNGFFTYFWNLGKPAPTAPGIMLRSEGGGLAVGQTAAGSAGRFRLSLNANVQNLTNHANYTGFVGTLTSPLFGKPQTVFGTRKVEIGLGLSF